MFRTALALIVLSGLAAGSFLGAVYQLDRWDRRSREAAVERANARYFAEVADAIKKGDTATINRLAEQHNSIVAGYYGE